MLHLTFYICSKSSRYFFCKIRKWTLNYLTCCLTNRYLTSITAKRFVSVWPTIAWFLGSSPGKQPQFSISWLGCIFAYQSEQSCIWYRIKGCIQTWLLVIKWRVFLFIYRILTVLQLAVMRILYEICVLFYIFSWPLAGPFLFWQKFSSHRATSAGRVLCPPVVIAQNNR